MSLLFRGRPRPAEPEARSTFPTISTADYASLFGGGFGSVSMAAAETSLQSVAFRAGVDLIASLVSESPLDVFSGAGTGRAQRTMPANLKDPGADGRGLEDWVYRLVTSWLIRGNAYAIETDWDARGRATALDLLHPDDVRAQVVDGAPQWRVNGTLVEEQATFQHHRVNPMPGRLLGLSPIELHATTLGISLTSARFGAQWFKDGAHPSGLLTTAGKLQESDADTAKKRFMAAMSGTREPAVLGLGWEYKPIQITPEESQFLQTQGFSEAQAARILGPGVAEILGYDSGGSMTYANVSDRSVHLLQFTVNRWYRRVERVLFGLLPSPQWVRFNRDAVMQSTTLQRYQAHQLALANKWKTVNEVRDDEDMPRVAWGDEPNGTASAPAGGDTDGNPAGA